MFVDEEAELGSDNEENDDIVHQVRDEEDSQGEDDDDSLDEFVIHQGDDEEVGDINKSMLEFHQQMVEQDDQRAHEEIINQVITGRNKKRRIDYFDEEAKRLISKLRRVDDMPVEERQQFGRLVIEEGGGQVEVDEQEVERLRENMRLKEM